MPPLPCRAAAAAALLYADTAAAHARLMARRRFMPLLHATSAYAATWLRHDTVSCYAQYADFDLR